MREYEERREIEKFYEKATKNIKAQIEAKGVSMKGSAKGLALSEIMAVIDREMEIFIAEELNTARKLLREYYKKYTEVESLKREIYENQEKLKEQQAVVELVSLLTDETLKNAIIAYNSTKNNHRYGNNEDAKAIAIAYIKSKGRQDLEDAFEGDKE